MKDIGPLSADRFLRKSGVNWRRREPPHLFVQKTRENRKKMKKNFGQKCGIGKETPMPKMRQIGHCNVYNVGGVWYVAHRGEIVSKHDCKLHALRAAKRLNWESKNEHRIKHVDLSARR